MSRSRKAAETSRRVPEIAKEDGPSPGAHLDARTAGPVAERGVARGIVESLRRHGVEYVFFMTGGDQAFWIESKEAGLNLVLARSENSAVYMADGYARAAGKPGVVYAQWGPGAANAAGALADALWSRSPVVVLTSSMATTTAYRNEYQELDQLPLFDAVTKWNKAAPRADRAAELMEMALRVASSGCPGPVHLDIPRDFFDEDGAVFSPHAAVAQATPPAPDLTAVREVLEVLRTASRPLILAGTGVLLAGAEEELRLFAEETSIPVATSAGGKGALSEDHSLAAGVVGRYSRKVSNATMAEADVILVLGSRLGALVSDGYRLVSPEAKLAQVDVDPEALGSTYPVAIAVHADVRSTLVELTRHVHAEPFGARHSAWAEMVSQRVNEWRRRFEEAAAAPDEPGCIRGEAVIKCLRDAAQDDDVLVADTAYMAAWTAALYPIRKPGRYYLRCGGSLGWAFPAALGAQLARPEARVFCVIGDGGIGYHIGDIETAVRKNIPAITVVFNNASLAFEYQVQKHLYGGNIIPEVNDFLDIDHGAVARAFGARGWRVRTKDELNAALEEAIEGRAPSVIDVVVSKEQAAPVTTYESVIERAL